MPRPMFDQENQGTASQRAATSSYSTVNEIISPRHKRRSRVGGWGGFKLSTPMNEWKNIPDFNDFIFIHVARPMSEAPLSECQPQQANACSPP